MILFEIIKQLELDVFCDLLHGITKDFETKEAFKKALETEISKKELQRINAAALKEGHHPLSFSFKQ